jgi:hypothetical protein
MRRTVALARRRRSVLPHAAEALRATLLAHIGTGGSLPWGVRAL